MDAEEARAIDDTIWWAVGRRAILKSLLDRREIRQRKLGNILEIGCGSGGDLSLLSRYGKVWGLERSTALAQRARDRGVAVEVFSDPDSLDRDVPPDIDLFCMFDVLEHIEDDNGFVQGLSKRNPKEHFYLLSVPAYQFLYGPHDELLHHFRRYSKKGLAKLLWENGYELVSGGYYMFFLFPLAIASRLMEALRARLGIEVTKVNIGRVAAPVNWLFIKLLRLEAFLGRFIRFPFGLWIVVLARRRR
jgi:SAM-dependent methyltransferase